ncbi:MAG: NAD(+) synthase [Chitinophagaceae bacterium]|nr:NAD(+) synthase [Oligoflexus sp.]
MDTLRIAGGSLNQIPFDWEGNYQRIATLIHEAKRQNVQLLCFPELSITGYNCEDMFSSVHTARMALANLERIVSLTDDMTVIVGLPIYHRGSMYNCAAVIQNKTILGINPKKILTREGVHYEPRWFRAWPFHREETIHLLGRDIPFGDVCYHLGTLQLGVVICEEAWSSEGTASDSSLSGCELVVNLSASHFALGKSKTRETLVADASRAFQAYYLYTNLVGLESGRIIYDGEILLGEFGKISRRSKRFVLTDGLLLVKDIDLDLARVSKLKTRSVLDMTTTAQDERAVTGHGLKKTSPKDPAIDARWLGVSEDVYQTPELEFVQAQKVGLFDYLRKSNSNGFMISLSGGCDSSVVAVLCAHTFAEALNELGPKGLAERLNWPLPSMPDDPASWIKSRITTIYQATAQSGSVTQEAAKALALAIGSEHYEVNVQDLVDKYVDHAAALIGRPLDWKHDDASLQNVQARTRAPMVWLLANIKGFLLLATSNRSEIAVGYATMDGDTAGGLAPIGGIDKAFLRRWLRWAETMCPVGLGALPILSLVNDQEPTAELRPQASNQTDEADLMPYDILNAIEASFIRDKMEPESILASLVSDFPKYDSTTLKKYVSRFYQLWARNQWKRQRYAACFHLDEYSLDPTSWCRYPILSKDLGWHE